MQIYHVYFSLTDKYPDDTSPYPQEGTLAKEFDDTLVMYKWARMS